MARGSLVELEAVLDLVQHLGYFEPSELEEVNATREEFAKTVYDSSPLLRLLRLCVSHCCILQSSVQFAVKDFT